MRSNEWWKLYLLLLLYLAIVLGCGPAPDVQEPREDGAMLEVFRMGYEEGYAEGSFDCERRMQIDAVKYGSAHWEGENEQWFVWDKLPNQRFARISGKSWVGMPKATK